MFIWGRNNNHLFRQNHKKTYSLPQKVPLQRSVSQCAAGYDYLLILERSTGTLLCYYQSGLHRVNNFSGVVDVATTDNMVVFVKGDGSAWIMEFNPEKITNGDINPTKISLQEPVSKVYMNYSDIFLKTSSQIVYHLRRNEWYETKTYSDPIPVEGLQGKNIKTIVPGGNYNYFLIENGSIFRSEKMNPTKAQLTPLKMKFKVIAAADYFVGVAENGRLYIWGEFNDQMYEQPTQFGKLSQEFRDVQLSGQNGYAITLSGEAWVWGKNANGELGISDYQPRNKPFPLITLQKEKIQSIYIGEGYTVCTTEGSSNTEVSFSRHPSFKLTIDPDQTDILPKKRTSQPKQKSKEKMGYLQDKLYSRQNNDLLIEEFSSLKLKKSRRQAKNNEEKNRSMQTEVVRGCHTKKPSKPLQKTPRKQTQKITHRSVSPLSHKSLSRSKSPLSKSSKSPYLQHQRNNSHSNIKKKKECMQNILPLNHLRTNTTFEFKYYPSQEKKSKKGSSENILKGRIQDLQEENTKLKQIIGVKDNIIVDITEKITLLEEAIEEHERSLTSRDNLMDQYQKRQKEYQIHIDELEKNIDNLIKGKNSQLDFTKQKDYFMAKMTEYEEILNVERNQYKDKIRHLEEEMNTYRSHNEKENRDDSSWMQNSKGAVSKGVDSRASKVGDSRASKVGDSHASKELLARSKPLEESQFKMNFIISRIEDSKVRIAKSATKLYEMMDEQ